jgi:hypothetical protein
LPHAAGLAFADSFGGVSVWRIADPGHGEDGAKEVALAVDGHLAEDLLEIEARGVFRQAKFLGGVFKTATADEFVHQADFGRIEAVECAEQWSPRGDGSGDIAEEDMDGGRVGLGVGVPGNCCEDRAQGWQFLAMKESSASELKLPCAFDERYRGGGAGDGESAMNHLAQFAGVGRIGGGESRASGL